MSGKCPLNVRCYKWKDRNKF